VTASMLAGRRVQRVGRLLPAVLAFLVLLPAGYLFDRLYRSIDVDLQVASGERVGVEYIVALGQLTVQLNDAQAAAVAGKAVSRQPLTKALDAVSAVDQRAGGQLRTTDRWTALRGAIENLPGARNAEDSYVAFAEASDLLLALFGVVRANSDLIRDPQADVYYLEDAAAEELPEALVMAGRLTDLSVLASGRPPSEQAAVPLELAIARTKVASPVGDLATDLQRAVDATNSSRLGDMLLGRLDPFRLAVDALNPATAIIDARRLTVDAARANAARANLQATALDLHTTLLHEMDLLLANRVADLRAQRWRAIGAAALALLLALVQIPVAVMARRRRVKAARRAAAGVGFGGAPYPGDRPTYPGPARHGEHVPGAGSSHRGEPVMARQERSGAR
jgi:hypothetical protein